MQGRMTSLHTTLPTTELTCSCSKQYYYVNIINIFIAFGHSCEAPVLAVHLIYWREGGKKNA